MKKLIKRWLTGQIDTDYKPSIGTPQVRTVSNVSTPLYESTGYTDPLNRLK